MATVPIPTLEIEAIRELSKLDQWVCFGKNKAPLNARTGHNASVENSKTWSSFDDACVEAVQWKKRKNIIGVGFVFTANDPYIGVDLDDCFNKDGSLKGWAHDVFNRLNSYTEKSPSGKGLHILIKGDPASLLKGWKNPKPGMKLEIYPFRRYFTVTGELLADSVETIEFRDKEIKEILNHYWPGWSQEKDGEVVVDHDEFDWNSQLDFGKMQALIEADQKFRQSWEKKRGKSIQDDSNSGYASSLAIRAINAGWTDKEVIALIIQFYNKWGAINTLKRNPKKLISTHFLYRVVIHPQLTCAVKQEHRLFLMMPLRASPRHWVQFLAAWLLPLVSRERVASQKRVRVKKDVGLWVIGLWVIFVAMVFYVREGLVFCV